MSNGKAFVSLCSLWNLTHTFNRILQDEEKESRWFLESFKAIWNDCITLQAIVAISGTSFHLTFRKLSKSWELNLKNKYNGMKPKLLRVIVREQIWTVKLKNPKPNTNLYLSKIPVTGELVSYFRRLEVQFWGLFYPAEIHAMPGSADIGGECTSLLNKYFPSLSPCKGCNFEMLRFFWSFADLGFDAQLKWSAKVSLEKVFHVLPQGPSGVTGSVQLSFASDLCGPKLFCSHKIMEKIKKVFCQMKVKNCPQLYYSSLLSFIVLLPSPFTKGTFLTALLPLRIQYPIYISHPSG